MYRVLFYTSEELPSSLCLDTAESIYMTEEGKLFVETSGNDYVSSRSINQTEFTNLLKNGLNTGTLDLSDTSKFGLFEEYREYRDLEDFGENE